MPSRTAALRCAIRGTVGSAPWSREALHRLCYLGSDGAPRLQPRRSAAVRWWTSAAAAAESTQFLERGMWADRRWSPSRSICQVVKCCCNGRSAELLHRLWSSSESWMHGDANSKNDTRCLCPLREHTSTLHVYIFLGAYAAHLPCSTKLLINNIIYYLHARK